MSKVKINQAEYKEVQKKVEESITCLEKSIEIWEENFSRLHANFLKNNFLENLYEEPKNKIRYLFGSGLTICGTRTDGYANSAGAIASKPVTATTLSSAISAENWIIGEIINPLTSTVGIENIVNNFQEINFRYEAKEKFERLLKECYDESGSINQLNYKNIKVLYKKLENIKKALQKILIKIEEYNNKYADLRDSAKEEGIKLRHSTTDDKIVLGVETSVTIDGQTIETTTSEALGSFYTYTNTTMNTEIATDYLNRTYGYDMNYSDIVRNTNTFTTETIQSGLYSHEFIKVILPEFNPQNANIYKTIGASAAVDLNKLESAFNNNAAIAGSVALFGGLLGGAFIGTIGSSNKSSAISNAFNNKINDTKKNKSTENEKDR